jgi:branched-chain amino acid transport system substrate-binding protein
MLVFGPDAIKTFSKGYFELAVAQKPKPQTVAIVAADAEFSRTASDGARDNVKAAGFKIVYDRTYPPATVDYTPIVRSVQAANPEIVYVASYPPDTVGILHAVNEIGLKTNLLGGAFVGLPTATLKTQLGPQVNGIVNVELWEPVPTMEFSGIMDFPKKY